MPRIPLALEPDSLSRRSFLQTAGLAAITWTQGLVAEQAAHSANRIPRKGIVPAALTPFDAELRIALKAFRRYIEALSAVRGVTAIMVNGATGQDAALTRDERRSLVAEAVAAAGSRTPIIAALRETKQSAWRPGQRRRCGRARMLCSSLRPTKATPRGSARVRLQKVSTPRTNPSRFTKWVTRPRP